MPSSTIEDVVMQLNRKLGLGYKLISLRQYFYNRDSYPEILMSVGTFIEFEYRYHRYLGHSQDGQFEFSEVIAMGCPTVKTPFSNYIQCLLNDYVRDSTGVMHPPQEVPP